MCRRDLVLKTAIKLFASKGFEGISVRMIADKAKISERKIIYLIARYLNHQVIITEPIKNEEEIGDGSYEV